MKGWQEAAAALCVVTGTVFDAQHHPVPSAKVYLQAAGKKELLTANTDAAGGYRFSVPCGSYTLRTRGEAVKVEAVAEAQFFDEPTFTVAGVTDNTYQGGHGSDTVLRSAETLAKEEASLSSPHHALAESYERAGHPLEAVREYQRAAEANPTEVNLFDWGTELLSHKAAEPAAEVFAKGVRLFPKSVRMLLGLATAWYVAGAYDKAAKWFFEATDIAPGEENPYLFLGKVEAKEITQSAGYEKRMARFAQLHPNSGLANYYYGSLRHDETLLKKAVTLDPHLGAAHLQLGILQARKARYPEAIVAYNKAIEANPELEEAHYRLSEAYRLTGDEAKAKEESVVYKKLSEQSAERTKSERRQTQRFVVALKNQPPQ